MISDLYYTNGNIIPFNVWNTRRVPNKYFMHWRGIVDAIPASWKQFFKIGFIRDRCKKKGYILMHEYNESHIDKMTSKIIYRTLVQRIQKPPTSQVNYKNELNVLDTDWSNIYLMPFKASHDVRTRIFQYKINLNCLMTNSRLFKMKIVDNVNCSLCSNFPETLKHIFWDCTYAINIWDEFNM